MGVVPVWCLCGACGRPMSGAAGGPPARSGPAGGSADAAEDLFGGIDAAAFWGVDGNGGGDGASSAASASRSPPRSPSAASASPSARSGAPSAGAATCDGKCPVCPFSAKGDNDEKRRKALDQHVRAKKDTLHTSYRENGGTGPVRMRDEDWESFIAKQPKALRTAANELREKAAQLQLGDELAWSLHALSCWRLSASRGGGDPLLPWPARKRN